MELDWTKVIQVYIYSIQLVNCVTLEALRSLTEPYYIYILYLEKLSSSIVL